MSGHDQQHPSDDRPFLCIPYWIAPVVVGGKWDTGEDRPLTNHPSIISYACGGIHAGPYIPGSPLDVTVDVINSGGGNAASIATVVVYWADPTAGFANPTFFGAATVDVPTSRLAPIVKKTPVMTNTIPATAPPHVCLVAMVSSSQDKPKPDPANPTRIVIDPINDRHWAQHNLQATQADIRKPTLVPVNIANPFAADKTFAVFVKPVAEMQARALARKFAAEPSGAGAKLRLLDSSGAQASEPGRQTRSVVHLAPHEQRTFQVEVAFDARLPAGRAFALETQLLDITRDGHLVGSLGTVVLGS